MVQQENQEASGSNDDDEVLQSRLSISGKLVDFEYAFKKARSMDIILGQEKITFGGQFGGLEVKPATQVAHTPEFAEEHGYQFLMVYTGIGANGLVIQDRAAMGDPNGGNGLPLWIYPKD